MNQSGVLVPEPIIVAVAAVTLIAGAARDLEDFNEELTAGHLPSWSPVTFLMAYPSASAAGD